MIKWGIALTIYICLSTILFLTSAFTINAGIVYGLLLLPFHAAILLSVWIFIWQNRSKTVQIKYWNWGIVLFLQAGTILSSPGNCFGTKQGESCYSNLQILLSGVPRLGPSSASHWQLVENAFFGLFVAYCIALTVSIFKSSVTETKS